MTVKLSQEKTTLPLRSLTSENIENYSEAKESVGGGLSTDPTQKYC
ncbi:hypothetical protein INT80_10475 [Gallibacterium anatis]|uniref:Uncharacterized protein n=1 Tax=Gallibacterium anatis TaxID=750 RepID=A0A930UX98_9PAST|nr:hypothetical protein [Gallibacterium anatis]